MAQSMLQKTNVKFVNFLRLRKVDGSMMDVSGYKTRGLLDETLLSYTAPRACPTRRISHIGYNQSTCLTPVSTTRQG